MLFIWPRKGYTKIEEGNIGDNPPMYSLNVTLPIPTNEFHRLENFLARFNLKRSRAPSLNSNPSPDINISKLNIGSCSKGLN